MADFLLEIGVEEIPDWMIEPALADLRGGFAAAFEAFGGSALMTDATPRRLVLQAKDLLAQAPDVESVAPGPYLSAGEKAAEGFARKQKTSVDKLAKAHDAKGERYVFAQLVKGQTALDALSEKLAEIVTGIHFPKTMYWTGKGGVKFIRPIRWIVALLDDQIVPFEIAGVKAGNTTRGHRVLGAKSSLLVGISNYMKVLRDNYVIVSAEERKARIEAGLGPNVQKDEELLKTLVYLTEFPTPIRGSFDSVLSGVAGRNSFDGDAASPALFFGGEGGRLADAGICGGDEYGWRSGWLDTARERAGITGTVQRCAVFLGSGPT